MLLVHILTQAAVDNARLDSAANPATEFLDNNFGKRETYQVWKPTSSKPQLSFIRLISSFIACAEQEPVQWDSLRPRPTRALGAGPKPLMTADPR